MNATPATPRADATAPPVVRAAAYSLRLAHDAVDLQAAQALRFEVFNLELDEGLAQSWDTGLDADPYDAQCEHLLVSDAEGRVVGTYRMQTGQRARAGLGYYSEREFDFAPFEAARGQILELGRACIHRRHRNFAVLNLLWKGIATYAQRHGARYLLGCSSLTSQDEAAGLAAFAQLQPQWAPAAWLTRPHAAFACHGAAAAQAPAIPRLLTAYLALGARICGAPAIDREFRTIDFLTWLDIESEGLAALQQRGRFSAA
jgi:putative hemolysin